MYGQLEYDEVIWLEYQGQRTRFGIARQYRAWRVLEIVSTKGYYIHLPECYSTKEAAHSAASKLVWQEVASHDAA